MTSSTLSELIYLFRSHHKSRPLLLLGAGASYRAGVPLAAETVKRIARASFAVHIKGMDWRHCNIPLSDWMRHLKDQSWFIPDPERLAENFPLAVKHFLNPQEFRREFFTDLIQPVNGINEGYRDLASLMLRRLCWTVLTTNFDPLIVEALRELQPHIRDVVEVNKTADDVVRFNINNRRQVVYLHGSVEYYRDRNLIEETQQLDDKLVRKLRPLLDGSPLVVVGYRGAEPSVMKHLLDEGVEESGGYPHGIFWCVLKGEELHENVLHLQSRIGDNLRLIEIDGFDELTSAINHDLRTEALYTNADSPLPIESGAQTAPLPFERQLMEGTTLDDLDRDLVLATLVQYCKHIGIPVIDQHTYLLLMRELGLLVEHHGSLVPTNACYLLFGRDASERFPYARISFTNKRKKRVVFDGNLVTQYHTLVEHLMSGEVNPVLRIKGERGAEERPAYPLRALTELSVNMVVHRDYAAPEYSQIDFEPGRYLRFTNPGGLLDEVRHRLHIEEDGRFQPVRTVTELRNELLGDIFFGLGSMDKAGSGLADVQEIMLDHGGRAEFAIVNNNESVRATLLQPLQAAPESSRVARRRSPVEMYVTNLLPFRVLPRRIWILPLREKPLTPMPLFEEDESPAELPIFIKHGNRLLSFADLSLYEDFARRRGFIDQMTSPTIEEYISNEDDRRTFVWLVGKHWDFFLSRWKEQGLAVEFKKKRAFFQLVEGDKNRIVYDSRARKGVRRDVVKRRERGQRIEHENEGIYYSVAEYGGNWAMQIKPFYMFTQTDGCTPIPSYLMGRRATRRIKFDRNKNVDDDLTFWARYLSGGQQTANIGGVGVDDLIIDFDYCSAEVPVSGREVEADEAEN